MWANFFRDGGFGMYPTAVFGFLLVASAVVLILRPEQRFMRLVLSLGVATGASGLLGTTMGLIYTFRYLEKVPKVDQVMVAGLGCAESLNNLVFGLMLVVLTALLSSIAAVRVAFRGRSVSGEPA